MHDEPGLDGNVEAYVAQLDELLAHSAGKYVVFAQARLVKICDTLEAALELGYAEFGAQQFMLQRVEPLPSGVDFHSACQR